jgi:hypothetical protein
MNQLTNVYAIVPRLPPAIDGVGDYALNLARQLRKDFNIQTHFIVGNSQWNGQSELEGFPVTQVTNNSSKHLVELLSGDRPLPVLLHYVGYGYAKRGCPVWLVDGLQRWRSLYPRRSLITLFHEVYASSDRLWESSFWLSPLQKNLSVRLARLSNYGWTSLQLTSELISKITDGKHCQIFSLPVFSTIGETDKAYSLSNRQRKLVIFGTYGRRLPIYQNSLPLLNQIVKDLEINEILDIGKLLPLNLKEIANVPIVALGQQSASEIHSILQNSIAGVIDYPAYILAKSTIFATYCACGAMPIVVGASSTEGDFDGLIAGKHYWSSTQQSHSLNLEIAQSISSYAYDWYQDHNLTVHAKIFAKFLSEVNN